MKLDIKKFIKETIIREMSGTGAGASMSTGTGEQYGTAKAFSKKKFKESKPIPSNSIEAQHLKKGDILSSGAKIMSSPSIETHPMHGKGKIRLTVKYPSGKEKSQVWGKNTKVSLKGNSLDETVSFLEYALKEKSLPIVESVFEYINKKYQEEKFKLNESLLALKNEKRGENLIKLNILRKLPLLLVDPKLKKVSPDTDRLQQTVKQAIESGEDIKNSNILRDAGYGPSIRTYVAGLLGLNKLNESTPLQRKLSRLKREKQDNKKLTPDQIKKIDKQISSVNSSLKQLKEGYKPYTGPGGPDKKQSDNNTKALGLALKKLHMPYKENRDYALKLWGVDDLNLEITNKSGKTIYVGYDRWGFVIDGEGTGDMDQVDLKTALNFIVKWYKGKIKENLNESRYSQFKRESSTRNPSETLSKAIREIRKKVYGLKKVMEYASKMKTEFKQQSGLSEYNKRTNESLGKLSLEIKELRNYLNGLK